MKFIVDCMLGKLAKWLKVLGFDTTYYNKIEDSELIDKARKEGRVLLTRDTGIIENTQNVQTLFIKSENWQEQAAQVLDEFNLWTKIKPYSRCVECNARLKRIPKRKAKNLVTPFVYRNAQKFAVCPQCGRVYWQGTHYKDMESRIEKILKRGKKK